MSKTSFKVKIAYGFLVLLLIAAAILGSMVLSLNQEVQRVARLTPTPLPPYGNVLVVTPDPNASPTPQLVRTGTTGDTVTDLQTRLQELGYYTGSIDGQFGPGTKAAVTLFQQQHGLAADGIVGPQTSAVLFSDAAKKVVITPTPSPAPTPDIVPGMTASGWPMLVNRNNYLPDGYQTVNLVLMRTYCDSKIVTIKGSEIKGEKIAVDALMEMLRAAHADGLTVWQVSAGHRSVQYQQELFNDRVYALRQEGYSGSQARAEVRKTVADPGASEHHLGLAFDMTVPGEQFSNTKQHLWLAEHCWEYGFILRYPKEKEDITGFSYEPWHIRYVGTAHSIPMRDEGLCLEEYLNKYAK